MKTHTEKDRLIKLLIEVFDEHSEIGIDLDNLDETINILQLIRRWEYSSPTKVSKRTKQIKKLKEWK